MPVAAPMSHLGWIQAAVSYTDRENCDGADSSVRGNGLKLRYCRVEDGDGKRDGCWRSGEDGEKMWKC